MSRLVTRVLALERRARQTVGCPLCRGQFFVLYDPATDDVSWLDEQSCCRRCGSGVKLFHRALWEKLA
jgi:hypothetical protein